MNPQQREHWERMIEHQQAVVLAARYWQTSDYETWKHLNEASNLMLKDANQYARECKRRATLGQS